VTHPNSRKGQAKPKFKIGDRVTEKPRPGQIFLSKNSVDQIKKFTDRKVGVVTDVTTKPTKQGANYFYITVAWENSDHVTTHSQMRLQFYEDASE
jgi:hypothetical protein